MTLLISLLCLFAGFSSEPGNIISLSGTDTIKVWNRVTETIAADQLGQYYLVSNGSLVKYDAQGDSAYTWSEPQTGAITRIDTGDPMRILVYQKDFNLVRFLNNRLAPSSGIIRLDDLGITVPLALASSRQGGFWVLDGSTYRLRQINMQLQTIVESAPLNLPSGAGSTNYRLIESGSQVLLLIPGKEIQVFDLFANLIRKIPLKVGSFYAYGDQILLVYPNKITLWKDPVIVEEELVRRLGGEEQRSGGGEFLEACLYQDKMLIRTPGKVILLRISKK
jgi:hypothetical protein